MRVYTIGMGTPDGSPIPIYNAQAQQTDYKRDESGNIVLTKLDEPMLQQIAVATGGSYRRGTSGGNEVDAVYKDLESLGRLNSARARYPGMNRATNIRWRWRFCCSCWRLCFQKGEVN